MRWRALAAPAAVLPALGAASVLAGCGSAARALEERHKREHPCAFSAGDAQCLDLRAKEKREAEARHETGTLRERARVEAERARLKRELAG